MRKLAGLIALPDGSLSAGTIAFGSSIEQIAPGAATATDFILPGFIDLQVNGAFGIDVMSAPPAALNRLGRCLAREGTTAWLPTALTAPLETLETVAANVGAARAAQGADCATILGLHAEGPFISPHRLGVHPGFNLEPKGEPLQRVLALEELRLITMAAELPGACEAIARLRARGVAVSIGHCDATMVQARAAVAAGASMFTHLFNAMRPLHQREPGVIGAALAPSAAFAAVIADGAHLHPEILGLIYRLRSATGMILTSDSVAAAKLAERPAPPTGAAVDNIGRLAGSLISMLDAVRMMISVVDVSPAETALMAATNPATVLGLRDRGRLAPGAVADMVVLDRELRLKAVFARGRELD
jgi:N-acetylglucosamine-6-phosphate deacetylase